jgi:hypothetical protein
MCSLCPLCSIEDDGNWMVANDGDNASVSARMFIKDEKTTNVAVFPSPQGFNPPSNDNNTWTYGRNEPVQQRSRQECGTQLLKVQRSDQTATPSTTFLRLVGNGYITTRSHQRRQSVTTTNCPPFRTLPRNNLSMDREEDQTHLCAPYSCSRCMTSAEVSH